MAKRFTLNSRGHISTHYDSFEEAYLEKWSGAVFIVVFCAAAAATFALLGLLPELISFQVPAWLRLIAGIAIGFIACVLVYPFVKFIVYGMATLLSIGAIALVGWVLMLFVG